MESRFFKFRTVLFVLCYLFSTSAHAQQNAKPTEAEEALATELTRHALEIAMLRADAPHSFEVVGEWDTTLRRLKGFLLDHAGVVSPLLNLGQGTHGALIVPGDETLELLTVLSKNLPLEQIPIALCKQGGCVLSLQHISQSLSLLSISQLPEVATTERSQAVFREVSAAEIETVLMNSGLSIKNAPISDASVVPMDEGSLILFIIDRSVDESMQLFRAQMEGERYEFVNETITTKTRMIQAVSQQSMVNILLSPEGDGATAVVFNEIKFE